MSSASFFSHCHWHYSSTCSLTVKLLSYRLNATNAQLKSHLWYIFLTNDDVLVSVLQLCYWHKVTVHCWDAPTVITWHNGWMRMEGHLVVILQCGVLFVGHFQRSLWDVVHLQRTEEQSKLALENYDLIRPVVSCESEPTIRDRIGQPLYWSCKGNY